MIPALTFFLGMVFGIGLVFAVEAVAEAVVRKEGR